MDEDSMILYEDKDLIVCNKPAGIPVQSASVRVMDMESILKNRTGGDIFIVHRLDQPVEGVLVFAKNKHTAADLCRQTTDGTMKKIYQAVCEILKGTKVCAGTKVTLVDYLISDGKSNKSLVVNKETPGAKRAELNYQVLKSWFKGSQYALLEVELKTGRHHQIRAQLANAGLPIVGDRKYNPRGQDTDKHAGRVREEEDGRESDTLALCAVSLTFRHPVTKKNMTFKIIPQSLPS